MLAFALKHLIYSLSGYYFLFLFLDWLSLGLVSKFMPLGLLPLLIIALALVLARINGLILKPVELLGYHFLLLTLPVAILGGILFFSRDIWVATSISGSFLILTLFYFFFKKKSLGL